MHPAKYPKDPEINLDPEINNSSVNTNQKERKGNRWVFIAFLKASNDRS